MKRFQSFLQRIVPNRVTSLGRAARQLIAAPTPSPSVIDPALPYGIAIDRFLRLNEREACVVGWIFDAGHRIEQVTASLGPGESWHIPLDRHRLPRPDVNAVYAAKWGAAANAKHGFLCLLPLTSSRTSLIIELRLHSGKQIQVRGPILEDNERDARSLLVDALIGANQPQQEDLQREIGDALSRVGSTRNPIRAVVDVQQFGRTPDSPMVSIVIPQYNRLDLLEPQMAAFAGDASLARCEIIHVVDSPWNHDDFARAFSQLSPLFALSVKLVKLKENLGFAGATNVGAELAQGKRLLLLNSDIIPRERGWLARLGDVFDEQANIGALGCKLLFENDTIQHAGMTYRRERTPPYHWLSHHPFKGLHDRSPAAEGDRPVPAVTGACLMVERDLYWDVGGLASDYLLGDFEDSDLCLRFLKAGRKNWYTSRVALYHLEGQSYAFDARRAAITRHNARIHHDRWADFIESMLAAPVHSQPPSDAPRLPLDMDVPEFGRNTG